MSICGINTCIFLQELIQLNLQQIIAYKLKTINNKPVQMMLVSWLRKYCCYNRMVARTNHCQCLMLPNMIHLVSPQKH